MDEMSKHVAAVNMERWVTPPTGEGDVGYMHWPDVEPDGEEHVETAQDRPHRRRSKTMPIVASSPWILR